MANLKTLLLDTAFFKMHPRYTEHAAGDSISERTQTWEWSLESTEDPAISALKCRNDTGAWACVLERLEWEAPVVDTGFVTALRLPLKKQFVLKVFSSRGGASSGDPGLMDDFAESSVQVVYGFQYSPAERAVKPLLPDETDTDEDPLEQEGFFTEYPGEYPLFEKRKVSKTSRLKVFLRPAKFLFVVELICCSASNNYEPTGAGRVARFFPRSYLIGNAPFTVRDATTHMLRPSHAQHDGHDHGGQPAEQCDGASHDYHSGFYADSNFSPIVHGPLPKWSEFFSYYSFDDRREYHVVKSRKTHARSDSSTQKVLLWSKLAYVDGTVTKLPRQGAFDNVHIAPAMIAPEVIRKKRQSGSAGGNWGSLDSILMAPVCHHDCFHMHWRWGAGYSDVKQLRGWTADGAYRAMGAPMIPPNQDLYVRCPSSNEVRYRVEIDAEAPAMRWQVFLDHGAGYMVGIEKEINYFDVQRMGVELALKGTSVGTSDVEADVNMRSWSMFYWNMRYMNPIPFDQGKLAPMERILLSEAALKTLIDL